MPNNFCPGIYKVNFKQELSEDNEVRRKATKSK